jgi:hypothetical protein
MSTPEAQATALLKWRLSGALKRLLVERHLYQSVTIELTDDVLNGLVTRATLTAHFSYVDPRRLFKMTWSLVAGGSAPQNFSGYHLRPPDVKLFCIRCDRREPFNLAAVNELVSRLGGLAADGHVGTTQVFALTYLCQSCKGVPEVLLVERTDNKLRLTGRSPMEKIEVPSNVPSQVRKYFAGALLASQANQSLPANFMLRTTIEQWARWFAREKVQGVSEADRVLDAYMELLPKGFKDHYPQLPEWYEKLSADIHMATGSKEVFEQASSAMLNHFEALRVFLKTGSLLQEQSKGAWEAKTEADGKA